MFTIFSRIIQYGVKNFWRNGWLSTTTVVVMVLALTVVIGLVMFNFTTEQAIQSIQDKIDISVYFKKSISEDDILSVKGALEKLSEVKKVDYVSSDQALEIFKKNHAEDDTIVQAIDELNDNPLEASLNIKAHRPDQYATIAQYLSSPNLSSFIDNVSYAKNQVVINRLSAIINNVNRGGLALTIFMAIIAGLVVFNTIRLAIYSNRDEIGIMRAVGASNSMVRGPFMVEGIISGILAAIMSLLLALPIVYFVSPYVKALVPDLNLFRYFYSTFFSLFGYQVIFGALIGGFSSFIAVRRYLKN